MLPPIQVKVGDQFAVFTDANPSMGFVVALREFPGCVYLIGLEYIPEQPVMPGSGGKTVLRFVAMEKGEGPIELRHVRPWGDPPEEAPSEPAMQHQLDHWSVKVT